MRKHLSFVVKILISALFVYVIFKKIPLGEVVGVFAKINVPILLFGYASFLLCWIINSFKWQVLLLELGFKEKVSKLFKLNLISIFYASFLPGGQLTGETIKCYKITKDSSQKGRLIISVLMDRLTGLIAIIYLGLFGILFASNKIPELNKIKSLFIFVAIASLLLLLFYSKKIILSLKKKTDRFEGRFGLLFQRFINVFFVYQGAYKTLSVSLLYSMLFQILNTTSVYLLARSIGMNTTLMDLFWINALVSIVLVIPITVMGLGLREGSFVFLLGILGVSSSSALGLSFLISLVYLVTGLLGGLVELYESHSLRLKAE